MARKQHARSKPERRMARAKPSKRVPTIDPAQAAMEDAAAEMLDVISCPVSLVVDHAERLANMHFDAEQGRDLAHVGARAHPDAPIATLLAEVADTLDRHARELGALIDRLVPHTDHDGPHEHVVPDDDTVRQMLFALFGDPRDSSLGDDGEP